MVNYPKNQEEAMKTANELQNTANELQQKMIKEVETNNRVTSTHNTRIRWLTVAIVALGILTIWANYNKPAGRYAMTSAGSDSVYVLDTKTSQVWHRGIEANFDLGTNENPTLRLINIQASQ